MSCPRNKIVVSSFYLGVPIVSTTKWLDAFALCLAAVAVVVVGFKNYQGDNSGRLLNVSYDPTREVYQEIAGSQELGEW